MYPRLKREVEGLRNGIIGLTRDLVRTPSLSLCETEVAGKVDCAMRDLEYDLVFTDEIGNIVGVIRGGDPNFTVVLNSHMDTVSPDPTEEWSSPPFAGEIVGDRIIGVGASDCKSGVATQIFAAHALARSLLPLRGNIVVAATVAEENGCSVGVRHLFQHTLPRIGMTPRFVVLGEPTNLKVGYGHDGWARFDIDLMGVNGRDVRNSAQQVFDILSLYGDISSSSPFRCITAVETPQLRIGEECFIGQVAFTRRLSPDETAVGVIGWLKDDIISAVELDDGVVADVGLHEELQHPYSGGSVHVKVVTQPWSTDLRHPLVERARGALVSAGLCWAPELWRLDRLGMGTAGSFITSEIGIPTIGFGPGEEGEAHARDESVSIPHLVEAAYGTAAITHGLIGAPPKGMH
jgi:acetylornithine deacetylase/succinyl-diaminopimelate desuccinylase-like protein